jgi:hypothetical protein
VELTRLERGEGVEDCRDERLEVHHTVGGRADKQHAEGHSRQILLELDAPVLVTCASFSPSIRR